MFEKTRRVERSGADAATLIRVDRSDGAVEVGQLCGSRLTINLVLRQPEEMSDADLWIVLDG